VSELTKEEKLDFIIKKSEELGITSYEYGQNTSLSDLGARNILTKVSNNPRTKNINIMLEYLESKVLGNQAAEPTANYSALHQFTANQIVDYIFNNKEKFNNNEMYKMLLKIENNEAVINRLSTIIKEINQNIEKDKAS